MRDNQGSDIRETANKERLRQEAQELAKRASLKVRLMVLPWDRFPLHVTLARPCERVIKSVWPVVDSRIHPPVQAIRVRNGIVER
jgi:hypothetical protein